MKSTPSFEQYQDHVVPHNGGKLLMFCFMMFLYATHNSIGQQLSAMSYNIRLDIASDNENSWKYRKDFLSSQVLFLEPDVLGVQEALPNQVKDLKAALPNYKFIGLGRDGKQNGEHSGIFYNSNKLQLEQADTFWLSNTPDSISIGWDAAYKRICTYGLFRLKDHGDLFWVFNTHLDHVGRKAQKNGMQLILKKIEQINTQNIPVILMGDFNVSPDSEVIRHIKKTLVDSREQAAVVFGPEGTFNAFKFEEPATRRIDYIMVSKDIKVEKYATLSSAIDSKYPSDHFPVYVQVKL